MVERVLVVTESFLPAVNGVTNSVMRVLETFKQRGIEAMVVAPSRTSPKHLGFHVEQSASIPLFQFQVGVPGLWMQDLMQNFRPDVVHAASPFWLGGQALSSAKKLGVPSVAVYQTHLSNYLDRYRVPAMKPALEKLISNIHGSATLNLVPTPDSDAYLRKLGVGNIALWGRGVDVDLFHPDRKNSAEAQALRQRIAPNGEIILGYVGRLAAEKQVARMQELFGIKGVKFLIVGDGPERRSLEEQFAKQSHSVVFTGVLSGLELAAAYAAMDIFVHFGTDETFGQTVQEAQAAGLPVVAPNRGGPKHLIEGGVSGFLVEPEENRPYARVVEKLATDSALRIRVGEAGRRSVAAKSWEGNNVALLEHYKMALELNRLNLESVRELV